MTHTTIDKETENSGSERSVIHTVDITSLDAVGSETYDPEAETDVTRAKSVEVVGQENGGYLVSHDPVGGGLNVMYADYDAAADGALIGVPSGTAIGQVRLRVQG